MKKYTPVILLVCLSFLLGCASPKEVHPTLDELTKFLTAEGLDKDELSSIRVMVLMPNTGCDGCVGAGKTYLLENPEVLDGEMVVIFTQIKDVKKFNMRFGKAFTEHPHVFVDLKNEVQKMGFISFYPEIIHLENEKIESRVFQDSQTSKSFGELIAY